VILSPYAGIGSEGYIALKNGRRFVGIELKRSYYEQARKNLIGAEQLREQGSLIDLMNAPPVEFAEPEDEPIEVAEAGE
jgi:DNA modification methylase